MFTAVLAVIGTLAGALLTGTFNHLNQRAARRADDAAARRREGLAAVTELASALADHRRAMWLREDLRLRGEDWSAARAESHATRSAITAPLLRVQLLLPAGAAAAQAAARAAYGLRGAQDEEALTGARERAIIAADDFVATAGEVLTQP